MKKHILLTGKPGIGKTTVMKKVISLLDENAGGFYTEEIRVMGKRTGFKIVTLEGVEGILAHVDIKSNYRVSKYQVDLDSFEKLAIPTLENAMKAKSVIVIDEIGKMELFSTRFREMVSDILNGEKPLVSVIKENGDAFTERIKKRKDVTVLTVDYKNRNNLSERILDMLKIIIGKT
ncbi:MAG: NTPase [wastewater metagenome]|nr:NTPase [Candidatus Loosdrechtia aerotolerans]